MQIEIEHPLKPVIKGPGQLPFIAFVDDFEKDEKIHAEPMIPGGLLNIHTVSMDLPQ